MWQGLVLEAKSLACERGGRRVFSNLGFRLLSGQVAELRGPNGSGKSSLLRLLAGLNAATEGALEFSGQAHGIAESAHYIGHHEAIKPALTVRQNLAFWCDYLGGAPNLGPFRMEALADDSARLLSEGQRSRLALSRLVSVRRPVWLLDEPNIGLDMQALGDLHREMAAHLSDGGMIIAATHVGLDLPKVETV
jgi:heme exporter protein A